MKKTTEDDACTTQQAARILGIPLRAVRRMIERGELAAWTTKGGHRRIPFAAINAYQTASSRTLSENRPSSPSSPSNILIVEDNAMQRLLYKKLIASWNLPIAMTFCEHGFEALLEVSTGKYDILLADIVMEGMDGYEVINNVISSPKLSHLNVAVLSSLKRDELDARGTLPASVVFFSKPVVYDELKGYLRACCAIKARVAAAL